jgi:hypothetical protein
MRTENVHCDFCRKLTTEQNVKKESINGFFVEIGYSINGWGNRKNFIDKISVEICNECFSSVSIKVEELNKTIKKCIAKRKG